MGKRHRRNRKQQQQKQQTKRYIIPFSQWKKFEFFLNNLPRLERLIDELQKNHVLLMNYLQEEFKCDDVDFQDMTEGIEEIFNIIHKIDKKKDKVNNKPKYDNMVAEIIIEEIFDDLIN